MSYAVLLALSIFFGFAFEEFYGQDQPKRPGGVRTFPLLTLAGAALYLIEPHYALAFIAGLLVLGAWIHAYLGDIFDREKAPLDGPLVVPVCVLIAYVLGPITLTQALWIPFALIVGAVLLVGARQSLHALVARVPEREVLTLGQFLLLVGVVLPLLYGAPRIPYTQITPFSVWLAVVAVSTLSYASYLLQRYALPRGGLLVAAALGGLYSSTATTLVLARAARDQGVTADIIAGIVAATAMMYVRMLAIVAVFDLALARELGLPFIGLAALAAIIAFAFARSGAAAKPTEDTPSNPLRLGTAVIFAILLIAISVISKWVQVHAGVHGVLALSALVGVTDIDPFVLSLAQGGAQSIGVSIAAVAILIAASSNNLLKAAYTLAFARHRESVRPAALLTLLCVLGLVAAWMMFRCCTSS